MAVTRLSSAVFLFSILVAANAQYSDDVDYNDAYDDMPIHYADNYGKSSSNIAQDDFYILSEFEDSGSKHKIYSNANDLSINLNNDGRERIRRRNPFTAEMNWYKPEKVYRYTKHRIPGYDYEELDYVATKNLEDCDDRSVWTHCLCQFTCTEPDVVDCYTPCQSGCECKEEFVFDEKKQQCSLPEQCSTQQNVYIGR